MKAYDPKFRLLFVCGRSLTAALLLITGWLTGCATSPKGLPITDQPCWHAPALLDDEIHIQYLGTGGHLISFGTNAILTAPFFSNFSLPRVIVAPICPKKRVIERYLPDLTSVSAVLVGHSHYDHLLDLPHILTLAPQGPDVYGSTTMVNLLRNEVTNRLYNAELKAGSYERHGREGVWMTNRNQSIRFMALRSMHAPHIGPLKFFCGDVAEPADRLPISSWGWKEGQTLAYLIDFRDPESGSILFRVLYQDSAVDGVRFGFLPKFSNPEDERQPDLAILCLASFHNVAGYPDEYLNHARPKRVLIGHWEDFFRSRKSSLKVVRGTNGKKFYKRLPAEYRGDRIMMPTPGTCWTIDPRAEP